MLHENEIDLSRRLCLTKYVNGDDGGNKTPTPTHILTELRSTVANTCKPKCIRVNVQISSLTSTQYDIRKLKTTFSNNITPREPRVEVICTCY